MDKRFWFVIFAVAMAATMAVGGCSKSPEATVALGNVSAVDVTEHVNTALRQEESLKGFDITFVALKGEVRPTGTLDSQARIDEAIKIARSSDGAHSIDDELTIKK